MPRRRDGLTEKDRARIREAFAPPPRREKTPAEIWISARALLSAAVDGGDFDAARVCLKNLETLWPMLKERK